MKNKEAYVTELAELALSGDGVAIDKETLKPCACLKLQCDKCLLTEDDYACNGESLDAWAEAEYVPTFKLDELVMVSDNSTVWTPRHYKTYDTNTPKAPFVAWAAGATSMTAAYYSDVYHYKYCRRPTDDEIAEIKTRNRIE